MQTKYRSLIIFLSLFILAVSAISISQLKTPTRPNITAATSSAHLQILPAAQIINGTSPFTTTVLVNPNSSPFVFAHVDVRFNPNDLQLLTSTPMSEFSRIIKNSPITQANQTGIYSLAIAANPNQPAISTATNLVTLTFSAKNSNLTQSAIQLSGNTDLIVHQNATAMTLTKTGSLITHQSANLATSLLLNFSTTQPTQNPTATIQFQNATTNTTLNIPLVTNSTFHVANLNPNQVPPGTYNLLIKAPGHLAQRFNNLTITNQTNQIDLTQKPFTSGDTNNDNIISIDDISAILGKYTQLATATTVGDHLDVNWDQIIDILDISLILKNFVNLTIPGDTLTNSPTTTPTVSASPTHTTTHPSPTPITTSNSSEFPCGQFPNANPGCIAISYQSWFDNVPATSETMSVDYTPKLTHQHYECNVPAVRSNGQHLKQGMKIPCQFVRYNHIVPVTSNNSGWFRSCEQGNCYERYDLNLPACQDSKYLGKQCISQHIHQIRQSDMDRSTEIRLTPNVNFVGYDGGRHFISANWQTQIGYRSSSEATNRYWIEPCGTYQRTIIKQIDKFFTGSEPIPTVKGTISIPFETNGGCGDQFKTLVFLDPSQHTHHAGSQTGETLMEQTGHFSGNFNWDTTKTTNGTHSLLFINLEGTGEYVAASGVSLQYNVQN